MIKYEIRLTIIPTNIPYDQALLTENIAPPITNNINEMNIKIINDLWKYSNFNHFDFILNYYLINIIKQWIKPSLQ